MKKHQIGEIGVRPIINTGESVIIPRNPNPSIKNWHTPARSGDEDLSDLWSKIQELEERIEQLEEK